MLVAEVRTRAFLASLVPVIVNAVLNEHQLVLDIVAFVPLGAFPRSRLGEKQRGKILSNWVSGKKFAIAQFSIRDPEAEGSVGTAVPDEGMGRRGSEQSMRAGGGQRGPSSSLRHVESLTNMPVAEEMEGDHAAYQDQPERSESRSDLTPTNETPRPLDLNTTLEYSPVERRSFDSPEQLQTRNRDQGYQHQSSATLQYPGSYDRYDEYRDEDDSDDDQQPGQSTSYGDYSELEAPHEGHGGGLRIANRSSSNESSNWEQDALRSLNLGRW